MKILQKVLMFLAGIIGLLIIVGLLLPGTVHVERSAQIQAPPARIFPLLNDLREFNRWSPWARIDPDTEYTFSDPSQGKGAGMSWASENEYVGKGSMRILESLADEKVVMALDFGPQGVAQASLSIRQSGQGSEVTWAFDNDFGNDILGRYFGLMMDGMVGGSYEKGLQNLKTLVEEGG